MSNDKKIHAAKKVFKIDTLSKNLCLKRSIIREWEKRFNLRETMLEAPDKLYTIKDAELFRSIKRMKIDKQKPNEAVRKHLLSLMPAKQNVIIKKTPSKTVPKALPSLPIDQFLGFEISVDLSPKPTSIKKAIMQNKPKLIPQKNEHPEKQNDFIKIPKVQIQAIKNKITHLQHQLFGTKQSEKKQSQEHV